MSSALSKRVTKEPVHTRNSQGDDIVNPPEWEPEQLHTDLLEMVKKVVNEAFGTAPWHKK